MTETKLGDPELLDLGVLRVREASGGPVLYAPGLLTRGVWLAGAAACGLYLYSVVVTFGWLTRPPTLLETPFWLLPLALGGLFAALAAGGVRASFAAGGLELRGFWPQRSRRFLSWGELRGVHFFEERTRSRERLYGVRLRFAGAELTFRTPDAAVWRALQERLDALSG